MFAFGLTHIGHAASALSALLHLPERGRTAAPALLTLAGFTPVQVELLVSSVVMAALRADLIVLRAKSHLPNLAWVRHSRRVLSGH